MKKLELNSSPFERIAVDIIWEILSRLPTKACLNCKLVCKTWYAIITNPDFADQRRAHGRYFSVLFEGKFNDYDSKTGFLLLDLDKSSALCDAQGNLVVSDDTRIRFKPKLTHPSTELKLVNVCNGLLCFKTEACWSSFVICNFLTGQQVTVKQPSEEGYKLVSCGWGYSPVSREYKILRIIRSRYEHNHKNCVAELHTVGTPGWRCVDNNAPELSYQLNAFLNGSLHGCCHSSNCIWSFNFDTEQFSPITLSDEMNTGRINGVSIVDSCLCCSISHRKDIYDYRAISQIWVMKEYGNKDSWVKLYVSESYYYSSPMPLLGPLNNIAAILSDDFEEMSVDVDKRYALVYFTDTEPDIEPDTDCVFGFYMYWIKCCHGLLVLNTIPSYAVACDSIFEKLPMTLMREQPGPKLLL